METKAEGALRGVHIERKLKRKPSNQTQTNWLVKCVALEMDSSDALNFRLGENDVT